jgi:hypothetical protein
MSARNEFRKNIATDVIAMASRRHRPLAYIRADLTQKIKMKNCHRAKKTYL